MKMVKKTRVARFVDTAHDAIFGNRGNQTWTAVEM